MFADPPSTERTLPCLEAKRTYLRVHPECRVRFADERQVETGAAPNVVGLVKPVDLDAQRLEEARLPRHAELVEVAPIVIDEGG